MPLLSFLFGGFYLVSSSSLVDRFVKKFARRRQDKLARKIVDLLLDGLEVDEFRRRCREDVDFVVDAVDRVLSEALDGDRAPSAVNFWLFIVRKFFRFLGVSIDWGVIRERLDIPRREVVRQDRAPTIEELRKILANSTPRNRVLFHLMAVCGLRISEALNLKFGDVWLHENPPRIRIKSSKTGRYRLIYLTSELVEALRDFFGERLENADPDKLLFPANGSGRKLLRSDVYQYFQATLKKCGLLKRDSSGRGYQIHLHSLRKFFKTKLEAAGVNPLLIEKWMGHNIGSVAQAYYRPSEEEILEEWEKGEEALTIYGGGKRLIQIKREVEEQVEYMEELLKKLQKAEKTLTEKLDT